MSITAVPAGSDRTAYLQLLGLSAIWGASFLFIALSLESFTPPQIVAGRVGFGALTLLPVLAVRRLPLPRSAATWGHLAVMGVFTNTLPFFLFAWGQQTVDSALAGIYNSMTPLLTMVFAVSVFRQEAVTRYRLMGLTTAFCGVVTILAPWRGIDSASWLGQLACLGGAVSYGLAFNYARRHLTGLDHPPAVLAAGTLLCATAQAGLLTAVTSPTLERITLLPLLSLVALGAAGTGIAYLLNYALIRRLGATTASTVTYVIPLFAVSLGALVLDEVVRWNHLAGGGGILLGLALAQGYLGRSVAVAPAAAHPGALPAAPERRTEVPSRSPGRNRR